MLPNSRIFYCKPLAQAILDGLEKRFGHLFYNKHHILASITHPEYKTRFFEDPIQKQEAIEMLTVNGKLESYFPFGFAAAIIEQRVCSLHTRPALATLNVCCSIAS